MGCFRDFIEGKRDFIQTMCLNLAQANGVPMSMEDDRASGEGGGSAWVHVHTCQPAIPVLVGLLFGGVLISSGMSI